MPINQQIRLYRIFSPRPHVCVTCILARLLFLNAVLFHSQLNLEIGYKYHSFIQHRKFKSMEPPKTKSALTVVELCQISPSFDSPESATELLLPVTFFDAIWIKFNPSERVYYYQLNDSTPDFYAVILPKLKNSLSIALSHFKPLAGSLTWPLHAPKPVIHYTVNHTVSLTVAESDVDFDGLSSKQNREAAWSGFVIPSLPISKYEAPVMTFQITLFPNSGFSIGYSTHHATADGKSITMFMKAWAHICKENTSLIPKEFTPSFDRTVISDPEELVMVYLKDWARMAKMADTRSLEPNPNLFVAKTNTIRATFELTREDIKKLRVWVESQLKQEVDEENLIRLSTFVLAYAYTMVCKVKAIGEEKAELVQYAFVADCRNKVDLIPQNYFGNCVFGYLEFVESKYLMGDDGVAIAAKKINELVMKAKNAPLEGAKDFFKKWNLGEGRKKLTVSIAGSPRFELYRVDFGFGKPKKVEVISIDKNGGISIESNGDENGGIEIGLVLEKHEMEIFTALFVCGLQQI